MTASHNRRTDTSHAGGAWRTYREIGSADVWLSAIHIFYFYFLTLL
jgi:hypothetical protein